MTTNNPAKQLLEALEDFEGLLNSDIEEAMKGVRESLNVDHALVYDPSDDDGQGSDFVLVAPFAWITVEGLSLYIRTDGELLSVDVYEKGKEMDQEIAGLIVPQQ